VALSVAAGVVTLRVDAASLRVVCARQGERDAPEVLSARDHAKIEKNIREDVLASGRFPEVLFRSTAAAPRGDGWEVTGDLSLHGVTRRVAAQVRRVEGWWVAEVTLRQPDYGIKPYSAMLGALKVQPDVKVVVRAAA
jgi:polyisoprenoid-binding protein YceI